MYLCCLRLCVYVSMCLCVQNTFHFRDYTLMLSVPVPSTMVFIIAPEQSNHDFYSAQIELFFPLRDWHFISAHSRCRRNQTVDDFLVSCSAQSGRRSSAVSSPSRPSSWLLSSLSGEWIRPKTRHSSTAIRNATESNERHYA